MVPRLYRITRRRRETPDTYTMVLRPIAPEAESPFQPGQFNMLYHFGAGEAPISISGDPADRSQLIHTIRAVGAVTRGLTGLAAGQTLGVRGPFGTSWPVAQAMDADVLVIAGGLGLAPVRPAIYALLAQRDLYGNLELIYGARTASDLLYRKELERWRGRFDFRVHVTVDRAGREWRGHVGVVPDLIARARFDPPHTVAFVCGPGVMMRYTVQELLHRGVAPENIHVSLERSMKCGIGLCGHCQMGPVFICKDGPVFPYTRVRQWFEEREI